MPRAQKQRDSNGTEVLSPLDKLFIVHVWREGKHRERERWSTGGPLLRGLDVALANYRHTVVELEARSAQAVQGLALRAMQQLLLLWVEKLSFLRNSWHWDDVLCLLPPGSIVCNTAAHCRLFLHCRPCKCSV